MPFTHALVSIILSLFVLGVYGVFLLAGQYVLERARENLEYRVILYPTLDQEMVATLGAWLARQPLVRRIRYVSSEEALQDFEQIAGREFLQALEGVNPFPPMYRVQLRGEALVADSVKVLSSRLLSWEIVREIDYPLGLLSILEERARLLRWIGIGVGAILTAAVYLLIFTTVRLAIFARRLEIRTMELVGATASYIERPFLVVGLFQGVVGALVAVGLVHFGLWLVDRHVLPLGELLVERRLVLLYGGLVVFGGIIGFLASKLAIRRFLHQKLERII